MVEMKLGLHCGLNTSMVHGCPYGNSETGVEAPQQNLKMASRGGNSGTFAVFLL